MRVRRNISKEGNDDRRNHRWLEKERAKGEERVIAAGLRTRAEFPGNRVFPGLRHGTPSFGSLERPTRDTATGDQEQRRERSSKRPEGSTGTSD